MTEQWQELKETITEMRDNDGTGTQQEVCKFLTNYMDGLEKQMSDGWIPVSERLPEENVPILLGIRFKDDFKYFVTVRMDDNYWSGIGRKLKGMGYWMPLPKPYDPTDSEKEE